MRPALTDVNELITSLLELVRRGLEADIEVDLRLADGLWPTEVDPTQLENAILNLVVNARDAMPQGGRLTLSTANRRVSSNGDGNAPGPGRHVMVAVADTGMGMTPEVLEHAFEPFFTTKAREKGSGLGLSMVAGFMDQSGGAVRIDSEPGRGTTVRLYFPRSERRPTESAPPALETSLDEPAGAGETILVVEDHDAVRELAVDTIANLGYRTIAAAQARAALDLLEERCDDVALLFTDVVLAGGMSGIELAREAVRLHPELKVLCTSGYTGRARPEPSAPADEFAIIRKPYRKAELARRLRAALGGTEARA